MITFDQRGCLSPRVVFVEGSHHRARVFAKYLHSALDAQQASIPRGSLTPFEQSEALRYADTMAFAGAMWSGEAHVIGLSEGIVLPPAGRHVHVVHAASVGAMAREIAPFASSIVAVGLSEASHAAHLGLPCARVSRLGSMQRPRLDGPVDERPASDFFARSRPRTVRSQSA